MNGSQWYGSSDPNVVGALKETVKNLPGVKINLSGLTETVRGLVEKTASPGSPKEQESSDELLHKRGRAASR